MSLQDRGGREPGTRGTSAPLHTRVGPGIWELHVPGAHMTRPTNPEDRYCPAMARVTFGDYLRLLCHTEEDPSEEKVELTVGFHEDPHWHQLRVPANALDALIEMLVEARDWRHERLERSAIAREGRTVTPPPLKETL